MKNSEFQKMKIQTDQGMFFPAYTYSNKIDIKNKDGEVVDYEYIDFILYKTAEEVYQEYLNPIPPSPILPTPEEMVIAEMSISMAQMQAESNQAIAELTTIIAMLQVPMV